jgi:hypothetical protein
MMSQRLLERLQGEALIETAPQMPAANAPREDIHEHRQVHKLHPQPNIRDITDPDLFRTHNLEMLDQVRIAWEAMLAVGRPPFFRIGMALNPKFPHQALDVLAVDREPFPLQVGCQAPRAIPGPLSRQPL